MDMTNVLGLILGGGRGTRLYPLTTERSKPAVPLAGKYRLIDIPMSSCFHAGIEKIAILTQFNSASLHRHIYRTYNRDMFAKGWVQILAAEQTPGSSDWYQGTADAVRKQMIEIKQAKTEYTLILSGDHLYRMDYKAFAQRHIESGADITIAVQPVSREDAPGLGILKLDDKNFIEEFKEKPSSKADLDHMVSGDDAEKPYMASMGIYMFRTEILFDLLEEDAGDDFGKNIIPNAMKKMSVAAYQFDGFWADIGTIRAFYDVNLELASPLPKFNLYEEDSPIYTRARFLPGSKVQGGTLTNVLLSDGCRIQDATIRNSVVGVRSIIDQGVTMQQTIMMGADFYEDDLQWQAHKDPKLPRLGIGEGSFIEGAIIDKNARIGKGVVIRQWWERPDMDDPDGNWVSREGIVVVPKGAVITDGTVI